MTVTFPFECFSISKLETCKHAHINIKSLSASSAESDDFFLAALALSGFGDLSLVLKEPWSSELVPRGPERETVSDADFAGNKRDENYSVDND